MTESSSSDVGEQKKLVEVLTKAIDETRKEKLSVDNNFIKDFKNSLGQSKSLSEVQDLCTKFLEQLKAYPGGSKSAAVLSDKWSKAAENELDYVIFIQKSGNEELLIIKQTAQHKEDKDTRQSQVQNESQDLNHDSKTQLENEDVYKSKSTLNDFNEDEEVFLDNIYVRKKSKDEIGRGAYKVVYRAKNIQTKKEVAWCEVLINKKLNDMREISILKKLNHPNVLRLLHYKPCIHQSNQTSTLVMITELMTGGDLRNYIQNISPTVKINDISNWGRQILHGLSFLHGQKPPVIHRDLKCANIFIDRETLSIKIGDFGLATVLKSSMSLTIDIGTPYYVAPEMFMGSDYKEPVDIYSFGLCLLEMHTREYPYNECTNQYAVICKKTVHKDPPDAFLKVDDQKLKCVIEKCIQHDPTERPTAEDVLKDEFFSEDLPG